MRQRDMQLTPYRVVISTVAGSLLMLANSAPVNIKFSI